MKKFLIIMLLCLFPIVARATATATFNGRTFTSLAELSAYLYDNHSCDSGTCTITITGDFRELDSMDCILAITNGKAIVNMDRNAGICAIAAGDSENNKSADVTINSGTIMLTESLYDFSDSFGGYASIMLVEQGSKITINGSAYDGNVTNEGTLILNGETQKTGKFTPPATFLINKEGDFNNDGVLDAIDLANYRHYIALYPNVTTEELLFYKVATSDYNIDYIDLNNTGSSSKKIDLTDLVVLRKRLASLNI